MSKLKVLVFFILGCAIIGYINYAIIGSWFGKNGPANIGSIEVSYVSMGKFLTEHGLKTWAPFWYLGFPFHVFYTPLLPIFEYFLHIAVKMPLWESYRYLTGLAYILGPISVFLLVWQLTKKPIAGIISGVFYSVGPTLLYYLVPGVAADKISANFWDPRRFTILVRWGEGPHLFSLIFMPLVGVFFHRVLEKKRFSDILLTAVFFGLTALSNAIGFFSAILLIGVMTFIYSAQSKHKRFDSFKWAIVTSGLTLGIISFWYNLKFIKTFFQEGGGTGGLFISLFPWGWIGIGVGIFLIYFLFKKFITNFSLAVSMLWWAVFFMVVYGYYATSADGGTGIEILPQALRYNVEVDLSLAVFIGVLFGLGIDLIKKFTPKKIAILTEATSFALGIILIALMYTYISPAIATLSNAGLKVVNLNNTSEKRIADWLNTHVEKSKGERVFVPGNYGFFLDWFSNIWQVRGGLFQASTNKWAEHLYYQVANGTDPEIAKDWFVAANTKYAVITTPGSGELYREIKNLDRFNSYQEVYNQNGDIIYQVPLKRPSLAKPVSLVGLKTLAAPKKGDDKIALDSYANWVENSSTNQLDFKVIDNEHYKIEGNVTSGEVILVQMTGDSGWRAYDNIAKSGLSKNKDPLGYLLLYPKKGGRVEIDLKHGTSWQEWLGYLISIITIIFIILKLINFDLNKWLAILKNGQKLA